MRMAIAGALFIAGASGVGAQYYPRSKVDDCLARYAAQLDDTRSDARTIAAAVNASCSKERVEMFTTGGVTLQGAQKAVREARDEHVDEATVMVLLVRAKRATK